MSKILGISAFYHDSAAALIDNGKIIAAAQEERFTRIKQTSDFPINAIKYCLEESGYTIDELDAIVFYDKPLLKFERLLETYLSFAPKGVISFVKSMPIWIKQKLFLKKQIYDKLSEIEKYNKNLLNLLFTEHHLSHAASAYFASNFNKSAILTIDGVGEWATASISIGIGNKIEVLKEMHFPHSVGLLYSAFTYYLGFKVNSGEYKMMGLAPYGNLNSDEVNDYVSKIKSEIVDIKDDGSIWMNPVYFNYTTGLRMINERKWVELFGIYTRQAESEIKQHHCDLALAIQIVTEEIIIKMVKEVKRLTLSDNICFAGGVALNSVANGKVLKSKIFKNIFIQPASGDAGGALGCALAAYYIYFDNERVFSEKKDIMRGTYLGPSFSDKEINLMNKKVHAVSKKYSSFSSLTSVVADKIAKGKVVGWFQGRMEFGPRALGNRSIIADATNHDMQTKLNLKIKFRESFRPFAPSVLREDAHLFFDLETDSPFMLIVAPVKDERRIMNNQETYNLSYKAKLNLSRSDIQAVTHVDFSARIQTVDKDMNNKFYDLIAEFKRQTSKGIIINTSFNVRGEPIVCTPFDAYSCFMRTEMDYLVIGNYFYVKSDQLDSSNKNKWQVKYLTKD